MNIMGFSVTSHTCKVLEGRGALRRGPNKPYITASRLRRGGLQSGMRETEPRFGETFVSPVLPRFGFVRPVLPIFCPVLPGFCFKICVFCPVTPGSFGFVQIRQDSFGFVRPLFAWFRASLVAMLRREERGMTCLETCQTCSGSPPAFERV